MLRDEVENSVLESTLICKPNYSGIGAYNGISLWNGKANVYSGAECSNDRLHCMLLDVPFELGL